MPTLCRRTGGTVSANEASGHGFCLVAEAVVWRTLLLLDSASVEEQPYGGRSVPGVRR
jgi:hypothetical protein